MCLLLIQLASTNVFIPFDNRKEYFLHKFIVTQRLGTTAMLLRSLKQVRILCPLSPQSYYNDANTEGSKQNFYSLNFLQKNGLLMVFLLHSLIL